MTRRPKAILIAVAGALAVGAGFARADEPSAADIIEFRAPAPPAVGSRPVDVGLEMAAPTGWPTFLEAADGRIMMMGGDIRYSADKGRTWSEPVKMSHGVGYVIRLDSGKLGGVIGGHFHVSEDEGLTWTQRGAYNVGNVQGGPYTNTLIQTRSGRIILPVRWTGGAGHNGLYDGSMSWGTLNGKLTPVEGHAHWPEPDNGFAFYSDDEGATWQRSEGGIMIWHQDGHGGMWPCDEPSVVEAANGDVLMFMRTTLGRVYVSRSTAVDYLQRSGKRVTATPGQRFDHPRPTPLAGSYSPCAITRIADSGHYLIVWNQMSGDEIRASYRRGRLSAAISTDDGRTWPHVRTIDTSVLPPAGKVEPDASPRMARGFDYVGVLPADYGGVSYPTVSVVDDTVFIVYSRSVVRARPGDVAGRRLRVLPLDWFYADEPPLPPGPRLVLQVPTDGGGMNTYDIPATYYAGRFYCHLSDLAGSLKSPVGRLGHDMFAPLHQVITCLGWTPAYDRSHIEDAEDPRLVVTCTHPHTR